MAIRVLFVDDEAAVREIVSMHLSLEGYEVKVASGGSEAIEMLVYEDFDVILLDIHMPGVDGIGVLQYMKEHSIRVRPIMLSGSRDLRALSACAELGALEYLPKPYNFHELVDAVERVLA
ncbi:MAG TPA: response regulator [Bacteroidota bacterium]|nr:response regulator [Bacteroidota bacterium]